MKLEQHITWLVAGFLTITPTWLAGQDAVADPTRAARAATPEAALAAGHEVRITTPTGDAAAAADVFYLPNGWQRTEGGEQRWQAIVRRPEPIAIKQLRAALQFGHHWRAGADGTVVLPQDAAGRLVIAWHEVVHEQEIDAGGLPHHVKLTPNWRFRVQVLDHRGGPLQRPVAVVVKTAIGLRNLPGPPDGRGDQTTEQGTGEVVWTLDDDQRTARHVYVRAVFPTAQSVHTRVRVADIRRGGLAPVQLRMPPTGQLRIDVRDRRGALEGGVQDALLWRAATPHEGLPPAARALDLGADTATFPHVGLGIDVYAQLWLEHSLDPVAVHGAGPRRADELTVLRVRGVGAAPVVRVRILAADGTPWAERRVVLVLAVTGRARSLSTVTDADGRLELTLERWLLEGEAPWLTVLHRDENEANDRGARVSLLECQSAGDHQLGSLMLLPEPVLLQGKVKDHMGQPVDNLELLVTPLYAAEGHRRFDLITENTRGVHTLAVRTDVDGRFTFRGFPGPYHAVAPQLSDPAWLMEPQWFAPEAKDATLRVRRSARLVGTLRHWPDECLAGFQLIPASEGEVLEKTWIVRGGDRAFQWHNLPPGKYTLRVTAPTGQVRDAALDLTGGDQALPDRITDFDPAIALITLTIVDSRGQPVEWARVTTRVGDRPMGDVMQRSHTARKWIPTATGVDVIVEAQGFDRAIARGVTTDRRIVLRRRDEVEARDDPRGAARHAPFRSSTLRSTRRTCRPLHRTSATTR